MVHLIEALTGRVQQYSGANGNLLWETSCSIISGTDQCDSSVEADFSITSTRNTLYYALTNGTVVALAIAEFTTEAPTPIPTDPTTALPTGSVSETGGPTETPASSGFTWPPTTEKPALPYDPETLLGGSSQDQPGSSSALDSNLVIILASIAGLFALLVLIVCCYICKQKKRKDSILRLQAVKEEEANRHMKEEALVAKEMKDLEEETMNALAKDPADSKKSKGKRGSNKAATPAPPATLDAIAETPEDDGAVSEGEEGGDDNMSETGIGVEVSIADESEFRPPEAAPEKVNRTLSYSLGKVSKEVAAVVPAVRKKLLESKENSENAHDESILKVNIDDSSTVCSKSSLKKMTDNSSIGEPGRLPLTVKDYLKERDCVSPLPVPSGTSVGVTSPASPMGPNFSPVGPETPNSPSWDVMSFDESLYMDDETLTTARSAAQRATSPVPLQPTTPTPQVPDDEPGAIRPGRPSPDPAEVSQQPAVYRPQPRPISYQPIRRPAAEIMSDNLVTKSHTNVPATYVKGASVRPRAGLFTRAENPNTSHSSAEYSSEGYVQEREGRAVYAMKGSPTLPTASTTSSARPASQQRGSGASKEKKSSKSSSPASYAYSAWDSFLSELAKVEDQFFNPTAARRQSPPPPPPPPKSRTRQPRKKQVRVLQAKYDSSSDSDNYDTESLD